MKKTIAVLIVAMMACALCTAAFAAPEGAKIFVTVSNGKGEIVMPYVEITVRDADGDGALTVYDALFAAHEKGFAGGAEAGFDTQTTEYGLGITKLWGEENGGSYGYYLNDKAAMQLLDPVKAGDSVYAFVYTDLTGWSDTYCYFDRKSVEGKEGDAVELILTYSGYDAEWNPVTMPLSGAVITVDGKDTSVVTDAEGKASITLEKGEHRISARSDGMTLVPPLCLTVTADKSYTLYYIIIAALVLIALACLVLLRSRRAKK